MADIHARILVLCITFFTLLGFFISELSPTFCLRLRSRRQHSPSLGLLTGSLSGCVLQTTRPSTTSRATRDSYIWEIIFSTSTTSFLLWRYQDDPLHLPRNDHIGSSTYPPTWTKSPISNHAHLRRLLRLATFKSSVRFSPAVHRWSKVTMGNCSTRWTTA